ncbi:hypothetical protein TRFO_33743 [Tritrichomonas foetus]|uniref:DNA-directed RNA polymerase subunit n=1 Tax=Tritrichomonas foetus TaxID=1144522 RepID=A0A1J4JMU1_9EUKA|nr:hypothetical protein TRFO_33743 [Tritrichomonas foetus]|eukprot:OHS99751.1 hypothetical protein TRFO_33743 [Tritrichomonas foetus]
MNNNEETNLISAISFGLFNPEDLIRSSSCEIKNAALYKFDLPLKEGLIDPRLGTISRDYTCQTCHQTSLLCPGHFGHIKLVEPMFHVGYINTINKILKCVCLNCGRLKVNYGEKEFQNIIFKYKGKERLKHVYEYCSNRKKCENIDMDKNHTNMNPNVNPDVVKNVKFWNELGLDLKNKEYKIDKDLRKVQPCSHDIPLFSFSKEDYQFHLTNLRGTGNDILPSRSILEILKQINDTDIAALGLNPKRSRPEWMILQVLPIPPPHVRPPTRLEDGSYSADDITHKLASIIQANNALAKMKKDGLQSVALQEYIDMLQWHITTYFVNDRPTIKRATTKNGRPIRTISERLKGKEGHFRGNLNGKRVDFSARSVISPDPTIRIDQVGVPVEIAKTLTFPEIVNSKNRAELETMIKNGPDALHGANYIITPQNMRIDLKIARDRSIFHLDENTIVERHLKDGDVVVFNRQPSLHKMSMMGHHAIILPGSTFRLNLSVTTPYNADFDGDEMNMHVPQSQAARAEVKHIMLVPNQIISPQGNKPIIGLVQDSLLASRLMTLKNVFLNRNEVMNIMMFMNNKTKNFCLPIPCIMTPKRKIHLWSGKQLYSMIMPCIDIELVKDNNETNSWIPLKDDTRLIIRNGEILLGLLDKETLGRSNNSLSQIIISTLGNNAASDFLSQSQLITNSWIESRGFSMGLIDAVASRTTQEKVNTELRHLETQVAHVIQKAQNAKLNIQPGMTLIESFEWKVNAKLNNAISTCGNWY